MTPNDTLRQSVHALLKQGVTEAGLARGLTLPVSEVRRWLQEPGRVLPPAAVDRLLCYLRVYQVKVQMAVTATETATALEAMRTDIETWKAPARRGTPARGR